LIKKRTDENGQPAKPEEAEQNRARGRILHVPDHARHRPPLPVKQDEASAGEQHKRTALDGAGNQLRPPALEALARHHAVLNGK
jgi:hypothetical protein